MPSPAAVLTETHSAVCNSYCCLELRLLSGELTVTASLLIGNCNARVRQRGMRAWADGSSITKHPQSTMPDERHICRVSTIIYFFNQVIHTLTKARKAVLAVSIVSPTKRNKVIHPLLFSLFLFRFGMIIN